LGGGKNGPWGGKGWAAERVTTQVKKKMLRVQNTVNIKKTKCGIVQV